MFKKSYILETILPQYLNNKLSNQTIYGREEEQMPKIKHLKQVFTITHLPPEQTKILLGMVVMFALQQERITLEEIQELHTEMLAGLKKTGRL